MQGATHMTRTCFFLVDAHNLHHIVRAVFGFNTFIALLMCCDVVHAIRLDTTLRWVIGVVTVVSLMFQMVAIAIATRLEKDEGVRHVECSLTSIEVVNDYKA